MTSLLEALATEAAPEEAAKEILTPVVVKMPLGKVESAPETKQENQPREASRPAVNGRLVVFVVTPLRDFPSEEMWNELTTEEKARCMPTSVRMALYELAMRGIVHSTWLLWCLRDG